MKTYNLNILGSKWKLKVVPKYFDPMLIECDGFTDRSVREMYVYDGLADCNDVDALKDYSEYLKVVKRHEIIHAFMYESGLAQCWEHSKYGHNEEDLDWMAIQFPKMLEVFKKAEAI